MSSTTRTQALAMPPPKPGKAPMKANVFRAARQGVSQLLPMFPYDGAGDIVPCSACVRGGPGRYMGYMTHDNVVDEVVVVFGAGGNVRIRTGDAFCGPKLHGVNGSGEEESFAVMTITQRQLERGAQPEVIMFPCEKCIKEVRRVEFEGPRTNEAGDPLSYPPMSTIYGHARLAAEFNASESTRTCPHCGHLNAPYPISLWGGEGYMRNTGIVEDAKRSLDQAVAQK